uniref:Broad Z1 isoform n=1 Tax=Xenos vesparum TaxID=31928 RepID=A0A023UJG4_9NEOP|nr:broad Z1 isoform [Xenos vesparum]
MITMVDTQHFCLRWNNYQSSITSAFENLRDDEDFVDVTLACDGKSLKAHRVVLSACSPYFRELLKSTPCKHPVIVLQDVAFTDLHALVEFIYHGEVNVHERSLSSFLKTAEILRVSGLTQQNVTDTRESLSNNGHLSNSNSARNTPNYNVPNTNVNQTAHHHHHQHQHHHAQQMHQNLFQRQQNSISLAEKLVEESMYTPSSAPNSPTSITSITPTSSMKKSSHPKRERRSPVDSDSVLCHDLIKKTKSQDIQQQQQQQQQQQPQLAQPSTINNNVIYNNNFQKVSNRSSPQAQPTDFSPTGTGQKNRDDLQEHINSNSQSPTLNNNEDDIKMEPVETLEPMEPMELVCTTTTNNDYDTNSNHNDTADEDDEDNTGNVQNSMTKMNLGAAGNSSFMANNDVDDDSKQTASSTAAYLMAAASANSSKLFQNITGSYNFSMAALAATEHTSPTNLTTTNNNNSANNNSTSSSANGNGENSSNIAPSTSQGLEEFRCQPCNKSLSSLTRLKRHIQNVHMRPTKEPICNICKRVYSSLNSLRNHKSIYHRNVLKDRHHQPIYPNSPIRHTSIFRTHHHHHTNTNNNHDTVSILKRLYNNNSNNNNNNN